MDEKQIQVLKNKIDRAQLVSFDLYDTLVFRKLKSPEDLFTMIEMSSQIPDFKRDRIRMQAKASRLVRRKKGFPHPTLHEIYEIWQNTNPKVVDAANLERMLEQEIAVPNVAMQEMLSYAKSKKKRVVIATDMYLERCDIENILKNCSITQWDEIYISSEIKKTKYEGSMFTHILETENTEPGEMLHIGDNPNADIRMAQKKGIHVFHYRKSEIDFAASLGKAGGIDRVALEKKQAGFWYLLGYLAGGPLYTGLATWIQEIKTDGAFCCLSRDGFVLTKILSEFGITDSRYVYSSRRAWILPHITKLGKKELELLPPYSCGQTVREILESLNLMEIPEQEFCRAGFTGYEDVIRTQHDIQRLKEIYKKNEKKVLTICERERQAFASYAASSQLFEKEEAFFDSGWSGTSQYLLQKIYAALGKKTKISFYYAGLKENMVSMERLKGCIHRSYFNEYMDKQSLKRILSATAVLELFFSQDAPALHHFEDGMPQFEPYQKREYIQWINRGIGDYVGQNKRLYGCTTEQGRKAFGTYYLKQLVLTPSVREAELIGNLVNIDGMSNTGTMNKYIAKIPRKSLKKNLFLDIYWEQGVYRHPYNTLDVKIFVWLRQRVARIRRGIYSRGKKHTKSR